MFEAPSYKIDDLSENQNPEQSDSKVECLICNQYLQEQQLTHLGNCSHKFCQDCLKYYLSYRIKNQFALIECPRQGCHEIMETSCAPFINLPNQLKFRYQKIQQNIAFFRHKSERTCPECVEPLMKNERDKNLFCSKCLIKYCPICFNRAHTKGVSCQKYAVAFLKRNYLFKRCQKCMHMVEKSEGCIHMTCLCKYEFCYQCGGDWNHGNHTCPPPRNSLKPLIYWEIKKSIPERQILKPNIINITYGLSTPSRKNKQALVERVPNNLVKELKKLRVKSDHSFQDNSIGFIPNKNIPF